MDNDFSGFDSFDGFDDAGFNSSNTDSDGFGFGSNDNLGLGDTSGFDDFGLEDNNMSDGENQFNGAFDSNDDTSDNNSGSRDSSVKKQSIIAVAVGIVIIIIVIAIATKLNNKSTKTPVDTPINKTQVINETQSNNSLPANTTNNTVVTNDSSIESNEFNWTSITSNESIQINDDYSDMVFTITNIEHRARTVDTKGNLVVKTRLLGSISGLTGVYEIEVPYNKGTKLVVGDSFTIKVLLGTFKDKTVVADISYK